MGGGPPRDSTAPFNPVNSCILNAVLGKDGEDVGVGVAAGGLLGSVGMDGDPEHDVVVEDSLALTIRRRKADRQHHRDANATARILEKRNNLRSNRLLPKLVLEDRVVRRVSGLLWDDGKPPSSDDEGLLEEIGTVEEKGMVL